MQTAYEIYFQKSALVLGLFLLVYFVLMLILKRKKIEPHGKTRITILERKMLASKIQLFLVQIENQKYVLTDAYQRVGIQAVDRQDEDHEARSKEDRVSSRMD